LHLITLSNTIGRAPLDEGSSRRRYLYLHNIQHTDFDSHPCPGEIRTRGPSKRAATDPRLRPRGRLDQPAHFS